MRDAQGQKIHDMLKQKAIARLKKEGYECFEYALINCMWKADILAVKNGHKIIVECQLNISPKIIKSKLNNYLPAVSKVIFFIPKFKLEKIRKLIKSNKRVEIWTEEIEQQTTINLYKSTINQMQKFMKCNEAYDDFILRIIKEIKL